MNKSDIKDLESENKKLREQIANLMIRNDYLDQYYQSILSGSMFKFEIDFTTDRLLSKSDLVPLKTDYTKYSYTNLVNDVLVKTMNPETGEVLAKTISCKSVIATYESGKHQINFDFQSTLGAFNNQFLWYRLQMNIIMHPVSGHVCGIIAISNIDATKQHEMELIRHAQHDSLTNLYNRYTMENMIKNSLEDDKENHALLVIDLDNFKKVNDTYGHQEGDSVLVQFANILLKRFRKYDIVARFGGDEFTVFMKTAGLPTVLERAKEVVEKCKGITISNTQSANVGASIGIALFPDHGKDFTDLFAAADKALYVSKENGKSCVTVYSDELSSLPGTNPQK